MKKKKQARLLARQAVVIGLIGDLGAGKTTFVQDFAKEVGIKERVISPTFVILKKYKIRSSLIASRFKFLIHIDAYRLDSAEDMHLLGWEEMIKNPENIIMIEWADKIKKILPKDCIMVKFEHVANNKRNIKIYAK